MTTKRLLLILLTITLPITGGVMIYQSFTAAPPAFSITKSPITDVKLDSAFEITDLQQFDINQSGAKFSLNIAHYLDDKKVNRQAIVYLPPTSSMMAPTLNQNDLRHQIWSQAYTAIQQHVDKNSLFLSWWDNAQRLHLFTGVKNWSDQPVAELYTNKDTRNLWQDAAGGFAKNEKNIKQLARWLTMDAEQALTEIRAATEQHTQIYLLSSVDDLARIQEIEQASRTTLALESQVFYQGDNIHSQIARVKQWAREKGEGNYLLQPLPGVGVRAWRTLDEKTENSLLVKLLPFINSLEQPLSGIQTVYKSSHGNNLSIYKLESTDE